MPSYYLYLSAILYLKYLSSGENFGGCAAVVDSVQAGQLFFKVYLLQLEHLRS